MHIWAFDFDGVIVDSATETGKMNGRKYFKTKGMAGILACKDVFGDDIPIGGQLYYQLLDKFLIVR